MLLPLSEECGYDKHMMKKVLVTGGTGFIGSHTVVELISKGMSPVIVDNLSNSKEWVIDRIERIAGVRPAFYKGDCRDAEFLADVFRAEGPIDGVIHFAAMKVLGESVKHPLEYYDNNIRSLLVLLEVMKQFETKYLVFSSSAAIYGIPKVNPVDEDAEIGKSSSPYGATKMIAEGILRDVAKSGEDIAAVALRYFNPIGAHSSGLIGEIPVGAPSNLVPYITQVAAGLREKLVIFGNDYETTDGTGVRDFIHVVDLARAHIATLTFLEIQPLPYYGVFNVGTGKGTSVGELVEIFNRVSGTTLAYEFGPRREGDVAVCYANSDKIKEALGWNVEFTVEDALRDAWRWQQQLGQIDKT